MRDYISSETRIEEGRELVYLEPQAADLCSSLSGKPPIFNARAPRRKILLAYVSLLSTTRMCGGSNGAVLSGVCTGAVYPKRKCCASPVVIRSWSKASLSKVPHQFESPNFFADERMSPGPDPPLLSLRHHFRPARGEHMLLREVFFW